MKDTIINHMARTLFVNAYANEVEEGTLPGFPKASQGQNWMDVAPATPQSAQEAAKKLYEKIEELNAPQTMESICEESQAKELGYCLVMEALGSGVSWADNHEDHGLKIPNIEAYLDFDPKNIPETLEIATSGL